MSTATPRVNSTLMQRLQGQIVLLFCKIKQVDPRSDSMTVTCSDGGEVIVTTISSYFESVESGGYIEIVGKVTGPAELKMLSPITALGDNIDPGIIDKVIQYTHDVRFNEKMFQYNPLET